MRVLLLLAAALLFWAGGPRQARAMAFEFPANHCAAGQYQPAPAHAGGSGMLLGTSAWAETGVCLKFPIQRLREAARDIDVMTWPGTTRIIAVHDLAPQGSDQLLRRRVDYEANHSHLFACHRAEWPMEWRERVAPGADARAGAIDISADRLPGGNSDGAYITHWSARAELVPVSATETSLHMRYEITAPGQDAKWAVGAIQGYIARLTAVAAGGKAPGAVLDPDCRG
ncbi:MAG TPA: hypothetical protein VKY65_21985 [Alphaproteobacteria bacterium]|nr:hypothetical protein [Alphaproteobacteria bacterium]